MKLDCLLVGMVLQTKTSNRILSEYNFGMHLMRQPSRNWSGSEIIRDGAINRVGRISMGTLIQAAIVGD